MVITAGAICGYVQHGGNFYDVEPGVPYRSAELSGDPFDAPTWATSVDGRL